MGKFLTLCNRVIYAIFRKDESLLEGLLRQVSVAVLLRLGMQQDRAKSIVDQVPWNQMRVKLAQDFRYQKPPPLKLVVARVVEFVQVIPDDSVRKETWEACRTYVHSQVGHGLTKWGVQCVSAVPLTPRQPTQVDGIQVTKEERDLLIKAVTDHAASDLEAVANALVDPTSAPQMFLTAVDSSADQRLRKILQQIVTRMLLDKLVRQGIDK